MHKKSLANFNLVVVKADRQNYQIQFSAKFSGIWYTSRESYYSSALLTKLPTQSHVHTCSKRSDVGQISYILNEYTEVQNPCYTIMKLAWSQASMAGLVFTQSHYEASTNIKPID